MNKKIPKLRTRDNLYDEQEKYYCGKLHKHWCATGVSLSFVKNGRLSEGERDKRKKNDFFSSSVSNSNCFFSLGGLYQLKCREDFDFSMAEVMDSCKVPVTGKSLTSGNCFQKIEVLRIFVLGILFQNKILIEMNDESQPTSTICTIHCRKYWCVFMIITVWVIIKHIFVNLRGVRRVIPIILNHFR